LIFISWFALPLKTAMYKKKRNSRTLEKANLRIDGMQSIDANLTLSAGLSVQTYAKKINDLRLKISAYNTALSNVDELHTQITDADRDLADYSEKMLLGVAVKYGKNSYEYEKAGGVRKSDRKRPVRRVATAID
jgi:hypothetical protein